MRSGDPARPAQSSPTTDEGTAALANGRSPNGHAPTGHAPNGNPANGHVPNGNPANGHALNGHAPNTSPANSSPANSHPAGQRGLAQPAGAASPAPAGPAPAGPAPAAPAGRHRGTADRGPTYREVFAVGEFRALWSAQVLSYAGDQFAQVAIAILVFERTGSPFLTGLAYALTYLPPILGGPLLSGLADLFPRRRVMIILDLIRAALVAGMVVPQLPFAGLCGLLLCTVLLGPPFSAARSALLPDVLPQRQYVLASSIGNITFQSSQITGFLAGAGVVAAVGPHRALAADAASFALSALIVAVWVKRRPAPIQRSESRPSLWALTRDGATYVFSRPVLRTLVLLGWLAGFAVVPEGLAAPYAHALGGGALTTGLLMAAMPIGMIAGAFLIGRLTRPATRIRIIGWLAMLSCAPLMASLAHPPLPVLLALWVIAGAGGAYQLAAAAAFVSALPPDSRARAFGIAQSGLLAAQGLGILAAGAAAELIGPEAVVAIAGLLGMTLAAILASAWTCQHTELLPASEDGQETAARPVSGGAGAPAPGLPVPRAAGTAAGDLRPPG